MNDVERYPGNFSKPQVNKILDNLIVSTPLTIYAPSGFGKSRVLTYLSYNQRYRRFRFKLRNTYFSYLDTSDISTERIDTEVTNYSPLDHKQAARFHREVVESKFLSALKNMCKHQGFVCKKAETDLFEFLDDLFTVNRTLRIYFILDGIEKVFEEKFAVRRDIIKLVRDRYRGRLEYIFGMSDAKYIEEIDHDKLGELANLIGQKLVVLPLVPSGVAESIHFSTHRIHRYLHKLWSVIDRRLQYKFQLVDKISGGYPPYIKYLLSLTMQEIDRLEMTKELELASKRLVRSLHPRQQFYLKKFAHDKSYFVKDLYFNVLEELRIIQTDRAERNLFSKIFRHFIQ